MMDDWNVSGVPAETAEVTPVTPDAVPVDTSATVAEDAPVGFGVFFGLIFLFSIPVIGWIAGIVMMFVPKRRNLNNYARAAMAWVAIEAVVVCTVVAVLLSVLVGTINTALGTNFNSFGEVVELVGAVATDDYRPILKQMKDQFPESSRRLVDVLLKKEYATLLDQLVNGEYTDALVDIESGKYKKLKKDLGDELYAQLVRDLKNAIDGTLSTELELLRDVKTSNISQVLSGASGGEGNDVTKLVGNVIGVVAAVTRDDYRPLLKQIKGDLPTKYQPVVDVLVKDEYAPLLNQVMEGDYTGALTDVESNKYPNLKKELGNDLYKETVDILEDAANGNVPEAMGIINDLKNGNVTSLLGAFTKK